MVDVDERMRVSCREPPDSAESPSSPTLATPKQPLEPSQENVMDNLSPPPTPTKRAPSPPRWRFVNDAKKTCGYSSLAAGCVVAGLSSDELAAKYAPPDVGSIARDIDEREVGRLGNVWHESVDESELVRHDRNSSCGNPCDVLSCSVDGAPDDSPVTDKDSESAFMRRGENDTRDQKTIADVESTVTPSCLEEVTHHDSKPHKEAVRSEALLATSTENANPLNNGNVASSSQEKQEPPRNSRIGIANRMGRRISLLALLIAILSISIILGIVLTNNEDFTPPTETYASETTLWDESPVVNATSSPTLPFVSVSPSVSTFPFPTMYPSKSNHPTTSVPPSRIPLSFPSHRPSFSPSILPTGHPSTFPSLYPSSGPSSLPSLSPSSLPSLYPTSFPSLTASALPSMTPSVGPSYNPSAASTMKNKIHLIV
eukprot:CCRYP_017403-RA/>CCRYP_017403-RA protein AED:0.00 eAED:0.00 QI:71/1/1/1/1/0.5/2/516/428